MPLVSLRTQLTAARPLKAPSLRARTYSLIGRPPAVEPTAEPPIAAALVRRSVGALSADRHACLDCRRTPLIGERVYVYAVRGAEQLVCELCRPLRRATPDRSALVRSAERALVVRRLRRSG